MRNHLDGTKIYLNEFLATLFISSPIEKQFLVRTDTPACKNPIKQSGFYAKHVYHEFCEGNKSILCTFGHKYLSLLFSVPLLVGDFHGHIAQL